MPKKKPAKPRGLTALLRKAKRDGWAKQIKSAIDEIAALEGCYFDPRAADHAVEFFEKFLKHSKGQFADQPFSLQGWQQEEFIAPLFGWKRPDGNRRIRLFYLEVPKKNGKSTLGSGLVLYLLVADGEPGAEIYSAASDRDQAAIVYREAESMVQSSDALSKRLTIIASQKRIVFPATRSWYQVLSADVPTKDGLNAHGLIFDELHTQRTRAMWDTLRYAGASRRQPLFGSITTAGYDRESTCWEQHRYAENVLAGVIPDTSFLALIYGATEKDDWTKPKTWRKANPSLGVTIDERNFASDCKEAQASPAKENSFKRLRLDIWTQQDIRWLKLERWDACAGKKPYYISGLSIEQIEERFRGRAAFGALDLSSTRDITAFDLLLLPEQEGEPYDLLAYFWLPGENILECEQRDEVPYSLWERQGYIEKTEGNVVDYDVIRKQVNRLGEIFNIEAIAADRWNATHIITQLAGDGFTMKPFGQGFASMSSPTKEFEKLVLGQQICHGGNPVMRWMAGNVAVEQDAAGNLKPSKSKSKKRIDGIVAGIMTVGVAAGEPEESDDVELIVL